MGDLIDKVSKIKWKPIYIDRKFSGYDVSETGMVRNSSTLKILSPVKLYDHSLQVTLLIDKTRVSRKIHNLVANAFLPNLNMKSKVKHINRDLSDNRVENLKWEGPLKGSRKEFLNRAPVRYGEDSPNSRYRTNQIVEVCKLLSEGKYANAEIARMTRVSHQTISNIKNGNTWTIISENYYFPRRK